MQLIENIFGSRGRISVLKRLSRHRGWWFNISELSKDMGINKGALSRIVGRLEKDSLIIVNKKGKIKLFKLNEKNLFVTDFLFPVLKAEDALFNGIRKSLAAQFPEKMVYSVVIYGSYAKGTERLESDIDLMVIMKNKAFEKMCRDISDKLSAEFLDNGIMLVIDLLDEAEFKKLYSAKEPLIRSVAETGFVLKGKNLEELIG